MIGIGIMTNTQAINQGQRLSNSKVRVETDGRTRPILPSSLPQSAKNQYLHQVLNVAGLLLLKCTTCCCWERVDVFVKVMRSHPAAITIIIIIISIIDCNVHITGTGHTGVARSRFCLHNYRLISATHSESIYVHCNTSLPAFARRMISPASRAAGLLLWTHAGNNGQTDRFRDPVPHTMQAVPVTDKIHT